MRVLVTGGSGYLGSELLLHAGRRGWEAVGTYRSRPAAGLVPLDVRDARAVEAVVASTRPAVVVHTAYVQDGPEARASIVDGSANVARTARELGARLIHLSSDVLFCGRCRPAYTESDEPCPVSRYGTDKADAERAVRSEHPGACLVRTSLIYGGDAPSKHERLALDAATGSADVAFFTDERRSPVAVGDLAAALLDLCELDHLPPVLNLGGADDLSRLDFARLVVERHGLDPESLRTGLAAGLEPPRPLNCALDSSLAASLLRTELRGARAVLGVASRVA